MHTHEHRVERAERRQNRRQTAQARQRTTDRLHAAERTSGLTRQD